MLKSHYLKGAFRNIWPEWRKPHLPTLLKWLTSKEPVRLPSHEELEHFLPVNRLNWDAIRHPASDAVQVTWLGHSTLLVQLQGLNILTDPVFAERASPVSWLGPRRLRPVPCSIDELPAIHAVLVSHNHYDHLDLATVSRLGNTPRWFVPLGLKPWFAGYNISNVREMDWWDECTVADGVSIACTPAQHWSSRAPGFDRDRTLWSSWAVLGRTARFFFAGDTGYCGEIGAKYGPFTTAAIPIGAYAPRHIMAPQHIDADEAVRIHADLQAKSSVAIHWGTFVLSDEPVLDPPKRLAEALQRAGTTQDAFRVLQHGQTLTMRS